MDKPTKPTVSRNVLLIFMLLVMLGGLCLLLFWAYMLLSPPPLEAAEVVRTVNPSVYNQAKEGVFVLSHVAMLPFFLNLLLKEREVENNVIEFLEIFVSSLAFYGLVFWGYRGLGAMAYDLAQFLGDFSGLQTYSQTLFFGAMLFGLMQFIAMFLFQPFISDAIRLWGKYVKRAGATA